MISLTMKSIGAILLSLYVSPLAAETISGTNVDDRESRTLFASRGGGILDYGTNLGDDNGVEIENRVVGGTVAAAGRYPYFTHLEIITDVGRFQCGGTLIFSDLVMTAAHCIIDRIQEGLTVQGIDAWINLQDLNRKDLAIFRTIINAVPNPSYDSQLSSNDIMILKLSEPVTTVQPVSLNFAPGAPTANTPVQIFGLGAQQETGPFSTLLLEATVAIIASSTCSAPTSYGSIFVDSIMICAGAPPNGGTPDTCLGDSGSAVVVATTPGNPAGDVQVGVTSFGNGCARPGFPGGYTRISAFQDFIVNNVCTISDFPPPGCPGTAVTPAPTLAPTPFPTPLTVIPPTPFPTPPNVIPPTPFPPTPTGIPPTPVRPPTLRPISAPFTPPFAPPIARPSGCPCPCPCNGNVGFFNGGKGKGGKRGFSSGFASGCGGNVGFFSGKGKGGKRALQQYGYNQINNIGGCGGICGCNCCDPCSGGGFVSSGKGKGKGGKRGGSVFVDGCGNVFSGGRGKAGKRGRGFRTRKIDGANGPELEVEAFGKTEIEFETKSGNIDITAQEGSVLDLELPDDVAVDIEEAEGDYDEYDNLDEDTDEAEGDYDEYDNLDEDTEQAEEYEEDEGEDTSDASVVVVEGIQAGTRATDLFLDLGEGGTRRMKELASQQKIYVFRPEDALKHSKQNRPGNRQLR